MVSAALSAPHLCCIDWRPTAMLIAGLGMTSCNVDWHPMQCEEGWGGLG